MSFGMKSLTMMKNRSTPVESALPGMPMMSLLVWSKIAAAAAVFSVS